MSALGLVEFGLENPLDKTEVSFGSFNPPGPEVSNAGFQFEQANSLISDTPVPGRFYKIKYGKGGLLETAGRAYGLKPGAERLKRAQAINSHPLSIKFWRSPGNAFECKLFGKGVISFLPRFTCGNRKCFATVIAAIAKHPLVWMTARCNGSV